MNTTNETIEIRDMGEAAALYTLGFKIAGLASQPNRPNHRTIIIENPGGEAEVVRNRYLNHDLQVDALSFWIATKEIKNRVYDDIRAAGGTPGRRD